MYVCNNIYAEILPVQKHTGNRVPGPILHRGDCLNAPLVIAFVPLNCSSMSSMNLQFPHKVPFITKEKMLWCPCPFKNEAYRSGVHLCCAIFLLAQTFCCSVFHSFNKRSQENKAFQVDSGRGNGYTQMYWTNSYTKFRKKKEKKTLGDINKCLTILNSESKLSWHTNVSLTILIKTCLHMPNFVLHRSARQNNPWQLSAPLDSQAIPVKCVNRTGRGPHPQRQ